MRSLSKEKRWVVWRNASNEGGGKIPFRLDGVYAKAAKLDDPTGWGTFMKAKECHEESQESPPQFRFKGLGVFLTSGLLAVDIDSCTKPEANSNRTVETWALDILKRLPATYIEFSPSGFGLKLFYWTKDGTEHSNKHYAHQGPAATSSKKPSISILRRGFSTVTLNPIKFNGSTVTEIATADLSEWLDELRINNDKRRVELSETRASKSEVGPFVAISHQDLRRFVERLEMMPRKPVPTNDGSNLLLWVVGVCIQVFKIQQRDSIRVICMLYHRDVTPIPLLASEKADKQIDFRIDYIFKKEGIALL